MTKESPSINLETVNRLKENRNLYQRISQAKDRVELQILLDNVTTTYFRTHSRGDNPLFLSLTSVAKKDFRVHPSYVPLFYNCLVQARIPVGKASELIGSGPNSGRIQNYYFIRKVEEKSARQAFLKDPLLIGLLKKPIDL